MTVRVVSMGRHHLTACGKIVDQLQLFQQYRVDANGASQMLGAALREGRPDLRVALDEAGEVVGFAWLAPRGAFDRSAYLRLIAVAEGQHGEGVGRRLVEALEATHLEHAGIFLLISQDNEEGQRFFGSLGYQQVGVLPGYLRRGLDELVYFKPAGIRPAL
jgi:ribosomal protein S18 acetylase RimI-like enzyme